MHFAALHFAQIMGKPYPFNTQEVSIAFSEHDSIDFVFHTIKYH